MDRDPSPSKQRPGHPWFTLLVSLYCPGGALADSLGIRLPEHLQLHGFLSQGFVHTSANRFFGSSDRDPGSWEFRELGANLSYQARPDLLLSAQVLSRTAGEMYDGQPQLDYGLIDFAPFMGTEARAGLRLGRLKNPLGFYNDTRDVPFTRPSIFLPQSIYFDFVRNLELASDGGGLYADLPLGAGTLSLQLYAGVPSLDENVEYVYLTADFPGRLDSASPWPVGRLLYELDGGRWRFAYSQASGTMDYRQGEGDFLGDGRIDMDFMILSAQYNAERWSLTAEFMREPVTWREFNVPGLNRRTTAEGFYLQGAYRPAPDWELMLRYDLSALDKDDRDGIRMEAATGIPAHNFFARDLTLGARWEVSDQFILWAEYHRVRGTAWLSPRENNPLDKEKDWDMFALQATFRF